MATASMWAFVSLVLVFGLAHSHRDRLTQLPPFLQAVNIPKFMGKWYLYAALNSCSWKGTDKFSDWSYNYNLDPKNPSVFHMISTWRNKGTCVSVPFHHTMTSPGRFIKHDKIGGMASGTYVIVATDYKSFAIIWGCAKWSPDGALCDDYWVTVKTRFRIPPPMTIGMIAETLRNVWQISLKTFVIYDHSQPCVKDGFPSMFFPG